MRVLAILAATLFLGSNLAQAQTVSEQTVDLLDGSSIDVGDVFVGRKDDEIRVRVFVDDGVLTPGNVYQLVIRLYNNPIWCDMQNVCAPVDLPSNGGSTLTESTQFVLVGGIASGTNDQFFGRFYEGPAGATALPHLVQGNGLRIGGALFAQMDVTVRDMDTAQNGENLFSQLNNLTADGLCGSTIACSSPFISTLVQP